MVRNISTTCGNKNKKIREIICNKIRKKKQIIDSQIVKFFSKRMSCSCGHKINQNELNKIPNIPPIKISFVNASCFLIDFEGNLWSFGYHICGQLGHGVKQPDNTPKIVSTLKDIQQISYGCRGLHFLAKNSQNQIFVTGNNNYGQLGTGDIQNVSIPKEINSQYSAIWRDEFRSRAKSARK